MPQPATTVSMPSAWVVDDDAFNLALSRQHLEPLGLIEMAMVGSGAQALRALSGCSWSCRSGFVRSRLSPHQRLPSQVFL